MKPPSDTLFKLFQLVPLSSSLQLMQIFKPLGLPSVTPTPLTNVLQTAENNFDINFFLQKI